MVRARSTAAPLRPQPFSKGPQHMSKAAVLQRRRLVLGTVRAVMVASFWHRHPAACLQPATASSRP